jgi:hypothetical protein
MHVAINKELKFVRTASAFCLGFTSKRVQRCLLIPNTNTAHNVTVCPVTTSCEGPVSINLLGRPGFDPRSVSVRHVVDKMALGQIFSPSTSIFSCHCHSTNTPRSSCSWAYMLLSSEEWMNEWNLLKKGIFFRKSGSAGQKSIFIVFMFRRINKRKDGRVSLSGQNAPFVFAKSKVQLRWLTLADACRHSPTATTASFHLATSLFTQTIRSYKPLS